MGTEFCLGRYNSSFMPFGVYTDRVASLLSCQINGSSSGDFTTLVGGRGRGGQGKEVKEERSRRGGRGGEGRRGGDGKEQKMEKGGVGFKLSETIGIGYIEAMKCSCNVC